MFKMERLTSSSNWDWLPSVCDGRQTGRCGVLMPFSVHCEDTRVCQCRRDKALSKVQRERGEWTDRVEGIRPWPTLKNTHAQNQSPLITLSNPSHLTHTHSTFLHYLLQSFRTKKSKKKRKKEREWKVHVPLEWPHKMSSAALRRLSLGKGVYLPLCSKFNIRRANRVHVPQLIVAHACPHTRARTHTLRWVLSLASKAESASDGCFSVCL